MFAANQIETIAVPPRNPPEYFLKMFKFHFTLLKLINVPKCDMMEYLLLQFYNCGFVTSLIL